MKSLSTKLTAMMLVICLVGMGLLAGISVALFRSTLIDKTLEEIGQNTAREAERINGWLENQISFIGALAVEYSYVDDYADALMLPRLNSHVDAVTEYFDVYTGYPDGRVTFASGFVPDYAAGWSSTKRPWYIGAMEIPGTAHVTSLYTDVQTGELCLTIAQTVQRDGEVIAVVSVDVLIGDLTDIVQQTDVGQSSYAFLVDADGGLLLHPNEEYAPDADDNFPRLHEVSDGVYAPIWNRLDDNAIQLRGTDGVNRYYTARLIPATGWTLYTAIPVSVVNAPVHSLILIECAICVLVMGVAGLMIRLSVRRMIVKPVADLTQAAEELASGGLDIRIDQKYDGEIGELIRSFSSMADNIREQVDTTKRLADGDLTGQVHTRSDKDVMGSALSQLRLSLDQFIAQVAEASRQVSSDASQISNSTQLLADGASRQAASVQEVFGLVSEMVSQINLTQDVSEQATAQSGVIVGNAKNGAERVQQMIQAVEAINEASTSISKVIKTIDDIAFQTNILALNAAVEAARAGQHGKGFAVVADEVRNLAQKSAEAARETDALIENSIHRAAEGTRIARETGESLQEILAGIGSAFELVDRINVATGEQADFIGLIHDGIEQINAVVSENAANAGQCAASVHTLSQQAAEMMGIVQRFTATTKPAPPAEGPSIPTSSHPPSLTPEAPVYKCG